MSDQHDLTFERLRRSNPAPVEPIVRPTADEFLADLSEPRAPRQWQQRLLVAAVVMLVVGALALFALDSSEDGGVTTSAAAPQYDPTAVELPAGSSIVTGMVRTERLGTPASFDVSNVWVLQEHVAGYVRFTHRSGGQMWMLRPTGLVDPAAPTAEDADASWPVDDLDGWLRRLDESVQVGEPPSPDGTREGLRAFDLTVDPAACADVDQCVALATNRGIHTVEVPATSSTRMWWFEMGSFEPFVVVATGDASALTAAAAVVESLGFGEPRPHPIPEGRPWEAGLDGDVPTGLISLPAQGGIAFELSGAGLLTQRDTYMEVRLNAVDLVGVWRFDLTLGGGPMTTIDATVQALEDAGLTLAEVGTSEVGVGTFTVFDFTDGPTSTSEGVLRDSVGNLTWVPPFEGRLWLLERGDHVLVVSAGSVVEGGPLDSVIQVGETLVETLRFDES